MFNKFLLFVAAILCIASIGRAQSDIQPCSTDEHYRQLLVKYPQLAEYERQFEEQLGRRLAERTTAASDTTTYDIPLVLHVVHDYGTENLNDTDLYAAAAYWAEVYMKLNDDTALVIPTFVPYIGNPRIRLHLATIDPNGKPTKGITRFNSYLTAAASDLAKFNDWPQNKYINIWFISAFGADAAGAAAYAYLPFSAAFQPNYDGIICLSSYANYSKTIPHELGHVLNLSHTWGNSNNPGVACGGTDNVDDTPPTKGHNPTGCVAASLYDTACATGYTKTYLSVLSGLMDSVVNYPDTANAENIMDYTYCSRMFTKGQAARMRTALTSTTASRNNLYAPSNLAATGALAPMPDLPPVADFIVNRGTGIVTDSRSYFLTPNCGSNFVFRNASWNDTLSSVAWTFSNDATTPASASMTTVPNQFTVPGWVSVSLIANSNAGSDTITNARAVYSADTAIVGGMGYTQKFASVSDISNWPMFNFYNNQFKWEFYTGAGVDDNTCIRYRSYDSSDRNLGNALGDHDDIYTPAFNLADASDHLYLNFSTSAKYTHYNLSGGTTYVYDSLEIDASTNGGRSWGKIGGLGGNNLANGGISNLEYKANSASTWVSRSLNVPVSYRTAQTFFRLRYRPGNVGNDMYFDNFHFDGFPADVRDAMAASPNAVSVFPNPASTGFNMVFRTGIDGVVNYTIKDLTGKVVYQASKVFAAGSMQQEFVPRTATPAAGMYFVTVSVDGVNTTNKLVIY